MNILHRISAIVPRGWMRVHHEHHPIKETFTISCVLRNVLKRGVHAEHGDVPFAVQSTWVADGDSRALGDPAPGRQVSLLLPILLLRTL